MWLEKIVIVHMLQKSILWHWNKLAQWMPTDIVAIAIAIAIDNAVCVRACVRAFVYWLLQ